MMIEAMEKKHEENTEVLSERVDILKQLKEEQSQLSLKFAKFNAEQIGKFKDGSMFARGLPFYTDLHTQVIQELEKDIARHEEALQDQRAKKEEAFKHILMMFDKLTTYSAAGRSILT